MELDVDRYLARIHYRATPAVDLDTLRGLMRAHLTAVPFENLDVVAGGGSRTDTDHSVPKIVDDGRGGWCFEVNGAFGALLEAIGFPVLILGAAVLLHGPSRLIEHATLEVHLDEPWLVDVGFGDCFIDPLALNRSGPQPGGNGDYEFLASPQGTTLARIVDGIPEAQYRFKRVAHTLADFLPAAELLRTDPERPWSQKSFATRLLDGGPDRVTLRDGVLKITRHRETGAVEVEPVEVEETAISEEDWDATLKAWFSLERRDL